MVLIDLRTSRCRSVVTEKGRIENHLRPRFGNWKVTGLRYTDLKDYIQERRKEGVGDKEGASDATINRELGLLRRAFNIAFDAELIDFKVPVKLLGERPERKQPFSDGEYQTFRSHLPDDVGIVTDFQREVGWRMPSEVLPRNGVR